MLAMAFSYGIVSKILHALVAILVVANLYLIVGFGLLECLAQGSSIIISHYLGAKKSDYFKNAYTILSCRQMCI